jgi:hypothetical protein
MKIILSDIINNLDSLKSLQALPLPVKVSYRLKRINDKLTPITKSYEEKRLELVREFGTKQPESEDIKVTDPEKLTIFYQKLSEVLKVEEDVDFEQIKISDLGDITVPPKDLVAFIFTE